MRCMSMQSFAEIVTVIYHLKYYESRVDIWSAGL